MNAKERHTSAVAPSYLPRRVCHDAHAIRRACRKWEPRSKLALVYEEHSVLLNMSCVFLDFNIEVLTF